MKKNLREIKKKNRSISFENVYKQNLPLQNYVGSIFKSQ